MTKVFWVEVLSMTEQLVPEIDISYDTEWDHLTDNAEYNPEPIEQLQVCESEHVTVVFENIKNLQDVIL